MYPTGKKSVLLFILILLIKVSSILFINNHFKVHKIAGKYIATSGGDTPSYIEPMENLLKTGSYGMYMSEFTPFNNKITPKYYSTIRTPHYGIFYLFFRLFFPPHTTFDLIALLQILVEVISIMAFSALVARITKSRAAYYITLFFLVFSTWITFYSGEIITESFTCSFLLLGLVFYHRWLERQRNIHLLISGAFVAYAILMKPFLLPYISFYAISIWIYKKGFLKSLKYFILFSVPLFLLLGPWVVRNYIQTKEFILFSKPMYYPCKKLVSACGIFLNAWGGDAIWWEGKCKSAGTFFFPTGINKDCEYEFPSYAFTPDYNLEDLREIRGLISEFQKNPKNDSLDSYIASKFNALTASYKQHNKLNYYFLSPIMRLKSAFSKSGGYYITPSTIPLRIFKIFQTLLYWIPFILGTIGFLIYGIGRIDEPFTLVLTGIPLSLIVVLVFILKLNEWRYFIHMYPVMIFYMIQLGLAVKNRRLKIED